MSSGFGESGRIGTLVSLNAKHKNKLRQCLHERLGCNKMLVGCWIMGSLAHHGEQIQILVPKEIMQDVIVCFSDTYMTSYITM